MVGQFVKTLVDKTARPGHNDITWNGKDEFDKQVVAGVYFSRMEAGEFVKVIKLALIK